MECPKTKRTLFIFSSCLWLGGFVLWEQREHETPGRDEATLWWKGSNRKKEERVCFFRKISNFVVPLKYFKSNLEAPFTEKRAKRGGRNLNLPRFYRPSSFQIFIGPENKWENPWWKFEEEGAWLPKTWFYKPKKKPLS